MMGIFFVYCYLEEEDVFVYSTKVFIFSILHNINYDTKVNVSI